MADELLDVLGNVADGMGVASVPVRAFRAWSHRDEGRNLLRLVQREIDARWADAPTRSDVYEQLAHHLQDAALARPFNDATQGDAGALEEVRVYLASHLGTESATASAEVADIVADTIGNHLGRAQTSPAAAVDVMGRLRHGQNLQALDALGGELHLKIEEVLSAIREDAAEPPQSSGLAQALVLGPLRQIDAVEDVRAAERSAADGDPGAGADRLLTVARRLDAAGVAIAAESIRDRAATLLADADRGDEATEVLLALARDRLARGTELADLTIRRLRQTLGEEVRWIHDALWALADWTLDPERRAGVLTSAAASAAGRDDELWFVTQASDALALYGQWHEVRELTARHAATELSDGDRLQIALDRLEAREHLDGTEAADTEWVELLRWVRRDATPFSAGIAWQRRGAILADREDVAGAHDAYRQAMDAWGLVAGFEEQIGDAFYCIQAVSIVNGRPDIPEPELRPIAHALRGGTGSPAARAEQLLAQGMQHRLGQNQERQALAAFWHAFAIGRRTGSLQTTLTAAERLGELYAHVGMAGPAIGFYLAAGKGDAAATLATDADPTVVASPLEPAGPRYYRAAVYAVATALGESLPASAASELGLQILEEAQGVADSWVAPQPAAAARRALAATVLALPDELRVRGLDLLTAWLDPEDLQFGKAIARALIVATNAEVRDASDRLLEVFAIDPYNFGITVEWVAERLRLDPSKASILRAAALEGKDPVLEALVIAGLADVDPELQERCEQSTQRWLSLQPTQETEVPDGIELSTGIEMLNGAGIVGRAATAATRTRLLHHLLAVASDDGNPELTRGSAAAAVLNMADALTRAEVAEAVAALTPLAWGQYGRSRWDIDSTHPLSAVRLSMHDPGGLRAASVLALARLVSEHNLDGANLQPVVDEAFDQPEARTIAAACDALGLVTSLRAPATFDAAMRHPETAVRLAALRAHVARNGSLPNEPLLDDVLRDPASEVRALLVRLPPTTAGITKAYASLIDDPNAYIRLMTRLRRERDGCSSSHRLGGEHGRASGSSSGPAA